MLTPTVLWHCQAHYFGSLDEYQVCIYDNRGGGRSSVNLRPYTAGLLARDASRLLDHLGWTREVHLVGLSLGGMVAQKLMLRAPERFESVAFISTYHSSLFAMPTLQDLGFFVKMFLFGDRSILPSFLRITFAKKWLAAEFEKDAGVTNYQLLNQALKRAMADRPNRSFPTKRLGSFAQLSAAVLHNLSASDLKKVRERNPALRLLVFGGTNDKVVRYGCAVALARILKCPLVTFHGTGHLLNIDQRDKLNVMLHAHFENIAP
ncbi:alpha/beta-hydrolase, partial [Ramicandelaber brevisporus]